MYTEKYGKYSVQFVVSALSYSEGCEIFGVPGVFLRGMRLAYTNGRIAERTKSRKSAQIERDALE